MRPIHLTDATPLPGGLGITRCGLLEPGRLLSDDFREVGCARCLGLASVDDIIRRSRLHMLPGRPS